MNQTFKRIWSEVLDLLKEELTELSFNTWIKTIEPLSFSSETIVLGVPAEFNKGILESRYLPLMNNAVIKAARRKYSIKIQVISDEIRDSESYSNNENDEKLISVLNPKYTFDTFVIGNSNRFAHAASLAVSEAPAKAYNPLFIYGGVGLGKTHLMHAIGHYIISQNSSLKVLYVSSERFTNELINAIKDDTNQDFRQKYRNIDILLIDDIQFIAGKERTQEEFFHTFNALYEADKQIIVSSDKSPKEIITLEERLKSRFEWGLIADIQPPDLETRIAILRKKAQQENMEISNDIVLFIADQIASNIRELEGALNRVIAYSSLTGGEITIELAQEALNDILTANNSKNIDSKKIIETVSRYFDIKIEDFKSKKRSREVSYPRQIAMYLCREHTDLSLPKIGYVFGRDHTTVIHACDKISIERDNNPETRRALEELSRTIKK